ncbi:hypothetical protein IFO70_39340 [Phormidium tenue FACHB-886]|nr:hypothetical protein [Phormidium tenue FACHB-886]
MVKDKLERSCARVGLYSSHLTTWRRQRQAGQLAALTDNKRGRKSAPANPLSGEVERLRRENERLSQRLQQAELMINIKKSLGDLKHHAGDEQQRQQRLMRVVEQLAPSLGVAPVCTGLGVSRASYYRQQKPKGEPKPKPNAYSHNFGLMSTFGDPGQTRKIGRSALTPPKSRGLHTASTPQPN